VIIRTETAKEWHARVSQWHPCFVWFRWVDGGIVILDYIERRFLACTIYGDTVWDERIPAKRTNA
jgi:hypothetical protein